MTHHCIIITTTKPAFVKMFVLRVTIAVLLYKLSICICKELNPLSDEFIDLINKEGKWKAGRNFHPDTPMKHFYQLGSTYIDVAKYKNLPTKKYTKDVLDDLPESFDPREQWPFCSSMNEIRDQGRCGACWAFGAVSAMTDLVCIHSNGTKNFHFSAEDVTTCSNGSGCQGGGLIDAWEKWVDEGLVSGGNYNSHEGCKPYSFPPCPNHLKNCTNFLPTPPCKQTCEDGYKINYNEDKKHGEKWDILQGEDQMKAGLYYNGPMEAVFDVYEDFANYKSGVYQHLKGKFIFAHAFKLMGWGVEDGTKYWLAANSWGTGFGENGLFKILRGENHCSIEDYAVAGTPLMEDY